MKKLTMFLLAALFILGGCSKDYTDNPLPNKRPKTYLWLFPDSGISLGPSRQHVRWWGDDPDGIIKGYLFGAGKFTVTNGHANVPPGLAWRWRTATDTIIAFPLEVKQDTFDVTVRAVDNTFMVPPKMTDQSLIFLSPQPYWDVNGDSVYDAGDVLLPGLKGAMDTTGAVLGMPVVNQPPSVTFAINPNDLTNTMAQPDTTFTAATFAWVGTDPDGDKTIASYEIALNDPLDSTRIVVLPGNVTMVSLVVPRDRVIGGDGTVDADMYTGTFLTRKKLATTIRGLKIDAWNTFYLRARDVAGDTSRTIAMPDPGAIPVKHWYVKNPHGRLLIINDFINNVTGRREDVLQAYKNAFSSVSGGEYATYEVLDIARGMTALQKKTGQVGPMVPPFIDPAFLFTLQLFDVAFWFSDQYPSLGVAQYPLFQYVRDPSHQGRVIFSTMFESAMDPRGALKDFAPIDSLSSVDILSNDPGIGVRLLPEQGDTRISGGVYLFPDSSDAGTGYPTLQFNTTKPFHSLFMRPIYSRADAHYIYTIQDYTGSPVRYAYSAVISDLRSVTSSGGTTLASGVGGVILGAVGDGTEWSRKTSGVPYSINSIRLLSQSEGVAVGDTGTVLRTTDMGETWVNVSQPTFENLVGLDFMTPTSGISVGTAGILLKTTDGGLTWKSRPSQTRVPLRSVSMHTPSVAVAAGDTITYSQDEGTTWHLASGVPKGVYTAVRCVTETRVIAVTRDGIIAISNDGGATWTQQTKLVASDLRGIYFTDSQNGWITGNSTDRANPAGFILVTADGGSTWSQVNAPVTQHLNAGVATDPSTGWCVCSGGVIIRTTDAGAHWTLQPKGKLTLGVIDGAKSFVFLGLPLHILGGDAAGTDITNFLDYVLHHEFGL